MAGKSKETQKMWALVKWVGGEDDRKMTPGIDVDHIKDFDCEKFLNDEDNDPTKVYVVEWHDTKKMPLGGWKCFHAMFIAVSSSIKVLEKRVEVLEAIKSPGPSPRLSERLAASSSDNNHNIELLDDTDDIVVDTPLKKSKLSTSREDITVIKESINDTNELKINNKDPKKIPLSVTPDATQFVTKEYFDKAMLDIQHLLKNSSESACSSTNKKYGSVKFKRPELLKKGLESNMKELGHERSNIFINRDQWEAAKNKETFTAMTTSLLVSAFPHEVLLKSNYKGGKSKNTEEKTQKYEPLDSNIINAIKESVKNHHENFKEGPFGTAINNKCGKLRTEQRRKDKEKKDSEIEEKKNED